LGRYAPGGAADGLEVALAILPRGHEQLAVWARRLIDHRARRRVYRGGTRPGGLRIRLPCNGAA